MDGVIRLIRQSHNPFYAVIMPEKQTELLGPLDQSYPPPSCISDGRLF
jgi:hypothetical protein